MTHAASATAYIGLGSNLDDPRGQIVRAFDDLDALPHSYLLARSSLYRSDPLGPADQPTYVNAVVALFTHLEPQALLRAMQGIEQAHRRVRGEHWGPRTLDLDLLLYGDRTIDAPELTVPHRHIAERSFVLVPLQEIAPHLTLPGHGALNTLVRGLEDQLGLQRLVD